MTSRMEDDGSKFSKADVSTCGIIQRISFKNFMCHEEFVWSPNSGLNIVTGETSSVLQGIY